ncbi:MAG TPA: crossover junction endodeoxyribonuclease RuvC [Candidatus Pacearchaeota archaeon]|nr:crossover junction endodeoxyribonuclease RuvC [Candidatus Parcubacteria bacterium]HNZ83693.1 crossover junction endodeoxyribonuclease RuvC [Candidatus Pacearchaeota archaeon]HOU45629.1 crossover junction endodeoxyribonuclease RuvC [Candidatus Pacearchaeota archaeon]HPM08309.1 crossover junction endodeoxyribonuclease RuvC [Candidatus Pacearchaeota archaeon]HQI74558.1 crossover junction endodeoxyribonuclease RuvC [Candidatus Pacearchaeota archaeon]
MIILGIDPGTATTGFGIIRSEKNKLEFIDCGCIFTSPILSDHKRLKEIHKKLSGIIKKYNPDVLVVEKLFFCKNQKTIITVSQSKGVILLTAELQKLPIFEYTPLQVKMAVTGYGKAEKKQIQKMVKMILNLDKIPSPDDAADALSVAICHANSQPFRNMLKKY